MQKLFVDPVSSEKIVLDAEQSRHIAKSLRMKAGDMLTVCDGAGCGYGCIIDEITNGTVILRVCYQQASHSEPNVKVALYQGLPKGDKMEEIVQKCVELGIYAIQPVLCARSVSRPDRKSADKKRLRYQKIALEAAQQSGRGIIPEIRETMSFSAAAAQDDSQLKLIFYEGGGEKLSSLIHRDIRSVSIYIGPEGGFQKEEVELIQNAGGTRATLGKRILRTQTAPVAALTAIMLLSGNLE